MRSAAAKLGSLPNLLYVMEKAVTSHCDWKTNEQFMLDMPSSIMRLPNTSDRQKQKVCIHQLQSISPLKITQ